jgi:hypothetical protein
MNVEEMKEIYEKLKGITEREKEGEETILT